MMPQHPALDLTAPTPSAEGRWRRDGRSGGPSMCRGASQDGAEPRPWNSVATLAASIMMGWLVDRMQLASGIRISAMARAETR